MNIRKLSATCVSMLAAFILTDMPALAANSGIYSDNGTTVVPGSTDLLYSLPRTMVKVSGSFTIYQADSTPAGGGFPTTNYVAVQEKPFTVSSVSNPDPNLKFLIRSDRLRGFTSDTNLSFTFSSDGELTGINSTYTSQMAAIVENLTQTAVNIAEMVMAVAGPQPTVKVTKLGTVSFDTPAVDPMVSDWTQTSDTPPGMERTFPISLDSVTSDAENLIRANGYTKLAAPAITVPQLSWKFVCPGTTTQPADANSADVIAAYMKENGTKLNKKDPPAINGIVYRIPQRLQVSLILQTGANPGHVIFHQEQPFGQFGNCAVLPIYSQAFLNKVQTATFSPLTGGLLKYSYGSNSRMEAIADMLQKSTNVIGQLVGKLPIASGGK